NTHSPESAESCGMLVIGETKCKKEENFGKEKEKPKEKPKRKISIRKEMGNLFAGFFDETDESID
ncbi:MAG: hypothetical protein PF444_00250, partial [Bacteroidales bacterium]|nr:hypothetical protein [Bacteroidales bacterium]